MGLTAGQVKAWGARWENRFAALADGETDDDLSDVAELFGPEAMRFIRAHRGKETFKAESRQKAITDMATAFAMALHGLQAAKANNEAERATEGLNGLLELPFQDGAPASLLPDFATEKPAKKSKKSRKIFGWDFPVQDGQ